MEKKKSSLAVRMSISLVCGLVAGLLLMFLRENLNSTGKEAVWATINSILFQDITAAGAEKALGIFYIIGQLFIRSLQLVIVPMVFTSITLAIGQISDTRTLGRISVKTIAGFLICSFFALLMACVVGIMIYNAGVFNIQVEGLEGSAGSTGSNPLNVILNIVPPNITAVFSTNTSVVLSGFPRSLHEGSRRREERNIKEAHHRSKRYRCCILKLRCYKVRSVRDLRSPCKNIRDIRNQPLKTGSGIRCRNCYPASLIPLRRIPDLCSSYNKAESGEVCKEDLPCSSIRIFHFLQCGCSSA